jgi:hypothetical protein
LSKSADYYEVIINKHLIHGFGNARIPTMLENGSTAFAQDGELTAEQGEDRRFLTKYLLPRVRDKKNHCLRWIRPITDDYNVSLNLKTVNATSYSIIDIISRKAPLPIMSLVTSGVWGLGSFTAT